MDLPSSPNEMLIMHSVDLPVRCTALPGLRRKLVFHHIRSSVQALDCLTGSLRMSMQKQAQLVSISNICNWGLCAGVFLKYLYSMML